MPVRETVTIDFNGSAADFLAAARAVRSELRGIERDLTQLNAQVQQPATTQAESINRRQAEQDQSLLNALEAQRQAHLEVEAALHDRLALTQELTNRQDALLAQQEEYTRLSREGHEVERARLETLEAIHQQYIQTNRLQRSQERAAPARPVDVDPSVARARSQEAEASERLTDALREEEAVRRNILAIRQTDDLVTGGPTRREREIEQLERLAEAVREEIAVRNLRPTPRPGDLLDPRSEERLERELGQLDRLLAAINQEIRARRGLTDEQERGLVVRQASVEAVRQEAEQQERGLVVRQEHTLALREEAEVLRDSAALRTERLALLDREREQIRAFTRGLNLSTNALHRSLNLTNSLAFALLRFYLITGLIAALVVSFEALAGVLGGVLVALGAFATVRFLEGLREMRIELDLSTEAAQRFVAVGRQLGLGLDETHAALAAIREGLQVAVTDDSSTQARELRLLGIELTEADLRSDRFTSTVIRLSQALAGLSESDAGERVRLIADQSQEAVQLLSRGNLEDFFADIGRLRLLTREEEQGVDRLQERFAVAFEVFYSRLRGFIADNGVAIASIIDQIETFLLPIAGTVFDFLTDYTQRLDNNLPQILQAIQDAWPAILETLDRVVLRLQQFASLFTTLGLDGPQVVDLFALLAVVTLLSSVLAPLVGLFRSITFFFVGLRGIISGLPGLFSRIFRLSSSVAGYVTRAFAPLLTRIPALLRTLGSLSLAIPQIRIPTLFLRGLAGLRATFAAIGPLLQRVNVLGRSFFQTIQRGFTQVLQRIPALFQRALDSVRGIVSRVGLAIGAAATGVVGSFIGFSPEDQIADQQARSERVEGALQAQEGQLVAFRDTLARLYASLSEVPVLGAVLTTTEAVFAAIADFFEQFFADIRSIGEAITDFYEDVQTLASRVFEFVTGDLSLDELITSLDRSNQRDAFQPQGPAPPFQPQGPALPTVVERDNTALLLEQERLREEAVRVREREAQQAEAQARLAEEQARLAREEASLRAREDQRLRQAQFEDLDIQTLADLLSTISEPLDLRPGDFAEQINEIVLLGAGITDAHRAFLRSIEELTGLDALEVVRLARAAPPAPTVSPVEIIPPGQQIPIEETERALAVHRRLIAAEAEFADARARNALIAEEATQALQGLNNTFADILLGFTSFEQGVQNYFRSLGRQIVSLVLDELTAPLFAELATFGSSPRSRDSQGNFTGDLLGAVLPGVIQAGASAVGGAGKRAVPVVEVQQNFYAPIDPAATRAAARQGVGESFRDTMATPTGRELWRQVQEEEED